VKARAAIYLILVSLVSGGAAARAPGLELHFDYGGAEAILSALDGDGTRSADVLDVRGVRAMVLNAKHYVPSADEKALVTALSHPRSLDRTADRQDPLGLGAVFQHRSAVRALLAALKANEARLTSLALDRLSRYSPADSAASLTVYFIAGGLSDGFYTVDGRADTFSDPDYGNAVFLRVDSATTSDLDGIQLNLTHELFHVVQGISRRADPHLQRMKVAGSPVHRLLATTLDEGTANLVADASLTPGSGPYFEMWKRRFSRNANPDVLTADFALFDALVSALGADAISWNDVSLIGFSTAYEAPLYFVGYHVAQVMERQGGAERIAKSLRQNPADVFLDYARGCNATPSACTHRFSASTVRYLESKR
jgi:hypothetical protein